MRIQKTSRGIPRARYVVTESDQHTWLKEDGHFFITSKCEHCVSTETKKSPRALRKLNVCEGFKAISKPVAIIRTLWSYSGFSYMLFLMVFVFPIFIQIIMELYVLF